MKTAVDVCYVKSKAEVLPCLVEVELLCEDKFHTFLRVIETLSRIGVTAKTENVLYQTCHILHKKDKYYIMHFKSLFALDGRMTNTTEYDIARQNKIISLLEAWGLIKVVNPDMIKQPVSSMFEICVVHYDEKKQWELVPKYKIGGYKK